MANPEKGEVSFQVADAEYTLRFSTNAICELEERLSRGLNSIVADLQRVTTVRALLWAGLRAHHPQVTIQQAGDIIDICGMPAATDIVGKALAAAFPPKKADDPNV